MLSHTAPRVTKPFKIIGQRIRIVFTPKKSKQSWNFILRADTEKDSILTRVSYMDIAFAMKKLVGFLLGFP